MLTSAAPKRTAWLFPGQGAQAPEMASGCRDSEVFARYLPLCEELAGEAILRRLEREGMAYARRNEIAAILTVLVSAAHLARLRDEEAEVASAMAGYSVGQWTALYAAGMLPLETVLALVWKRSQCMNAALSDATSGMCGVIGLALERVREICAEVSSGGRPISVSNVNAPGNVSVAGSTEALQTAEAAFLKAGAFRVVSLPVAGAWHSPLLLPAVDAFREVLRDVVFARPSAPVADNVSGRYLPDDRAGLVEALARHIAQPVDWLGCVRTMLADHVGRFVEIGYGDMLTRFGLFIDRSAAFRAYPGVPRRPVQRRAGESA